MSLLPSSSNPKTIIAQQPNRALTQKCKVPLSGVFGVNNLYRSPQYKAKPSYSLSDCSFIDRNENLIITGCTGTGKSFLATALGHQSCIKGYKVLYYDLGKLFQKLMMTKADGSYIRELTRIENHDLLLIDDFGLQAINNEKQMILMDLVEDRNQKRETIFCS
jgi:DNA replication protein DnaC